MFRNYFITAIRNILRNKIQSFIQVLSLSIGITSAILIGMYAWHEFTYDRYNEKLDRIYRLQWGDQVSLPSAFGHQIKQEIPEVENVVRMVNWAGKDGYSLVKYYPDDDTLGKEEILRVEDEFVCDSTIFDIFTFHFIQGDPQTALLDPNSIVLTESTAKKLFPDSDPVGQFWGMSQVTGIIEDVKHSHIEINMLKPLTEFARWSESQGDNEDVLNRYSGAKFIHYVLLPAGSDPSWLEKRINDFFIEKWSKEFPDFEPEGSISLTPLKDIYFDTGWEGESNYCRHGNLKLMKVLMAVALLILILAIINYVNLTTARASLRAREVGIRNVAGATKGKLICQFLMEAIVITLLSFVIALTLVQLVLPAFNRLAMAELEMEFLNHPATWIGFILSLVILGVVSGLYPAIYLTGFQTTMTLSGEQVTGRGSVVFRRLLLTFQFAVSIILVIGLLVIFRQLGFMKKTDPGFNREYVIFKGGSVYWNQDPSSRRLFREQLLQNPNVTGVAFLQNMMGGELQLGSMGQTLEINGIKKQRAFMGIDPDFMEVMGIELKEGRNLSWDRPGDYSTTAGNHMNWLVNETFVREFKLESPVGYIHTWPDGNTMQIVGVVKDFHFNSQHEKIMPMNFVWWQYLPTVSIRVAPENIRSTLRYIEKVYQELFSEWEVFDYTFLDEYYARQYLRDERTATIIFNFAIVAVLIACLGLFGLSSFMAARRTKEIGIRKSMGASVQSVFLLLSREFLKWVIISVAIACPAGWYVMNKWLQNFAYRTNISWWIFALAILIAFLIAFGTVTWQSLKTARTNPVEALRYE